MPGTPPKDAAGKGYTYRRRLVIPVVVIMTVTIIVGFALQIAATVNESWGRTKDTPQMFWGLTETCTTISFKPENPDVPGEYLDEVFQDRCHKIGEGDCGFFDDFYFGDPISCGPDPSNNVTAQELETVASNLKTAKALSGVTTFFSITPLPFVFLSFFRELRWGMYSMALYLLWFIFWVSTIAMFNKSGDHLLHYQPPRGEWVFGESTSVTSFYDSGAFLHIGAFVAIAVSCISFWASYLACFQVDVFDADGNEVAVEELLAKRQAAGNATSTQDLVPGRQV